MHILYLFIYKYLVHIIYILGITIIRLNVYVGYRIRANIL